MRRRKPRQLDCILRVAGERNCDDEIVRAEASAPARLSTDVTAWDRLKGSFQRWRQKYWVRPARVRGYMVIQW